MDTIDKALALRMKAGLYIFSQRGAVDLNNPDTAVVPLGIAQTWMAAFADEISAAAISKREREIADELEEGYDCQCRNVDGFCFTRSYIEKLRGKK